MSKFFYLLIFIIFCFKGSTQEMSILLGRPTNESITLNLLASQDARVYCEYGINKENLIQKSISLSLEANKPGVLQIMGLKPNSKYYYRVSYKNISDTDFNSGPIYHFQTQRKKGESFRFVVEADPHLDSNTIPEAYRLTLRNMLNNDPDFMIDLGDNVNENCCW